MELTVIGQSVKGRDLYLASWVSNPENPTILFLTQQHGNEQLTTEGALEFIKHLGTGRNRDVLDGVNVLVVPMLNPTARWAMSISPSAGTSPTAIVT